jgi:hypothetical protein
MKTYDAPNSIEGSNENPLCIFCDIQDLYVQIDDNEYLDQTGSDIQQQTVETQPESVSSGSDDTGSSENNGSGRGRVKDPSTDGRLKQNRDATAMARQADQGSSAGVTSQTASLGTGRVAGKPGRVARPWDGRLKHNREAGAQSAGR